MENLESIPQPKPEQQAAPQASEPIKQPPEVAARESVAEIEREIEKLHSDISAEKTIEKVMAAKPDGSEPWDNNPVPDYDTPTKHEKPWWKKAMVTLGLAGVAATGQAAEQKIDTTTKEPVTAAAPVPRPTFNEGMPEIDSKKLEQAGIVRIDPVEGQDTTKQVYLISLENYKSYDDILGAVQKAGFELSSPETMLYVAQHNPDMMKRSKNLMSLKYVTNKLGNMSAPTVTYDDKRGALHPEARELNAGIDSDYEQYRFVVELSKKTAQFQDGLAKAN